VRRAWGVGGGAWQVGRGQWRARIVLLAAAIAAASFSSMTAAAQPATTTPHPPVPTPHAPTDSVLDARTREVASGLRCPVCQGESIEQSPSELAQELETVVREQLAAGRTPEQVREYFVARYGEWILLQPKATGFNIAVYVVPPLLLLAGAAVIVVLLRRWTRAANTTPTMADEDSIEPQLR
jgi:cytochrome c-type biogenesis protein CcmH/NrfF